jgi:hypothetical protein
MESNNFFKRVFELEGQHCATCADITARPSLHLRRLDMAEVETIIAQLKEKDKQLVEKDKQLVEKDKQLVEKDKRFQEKETQYQSPFEIYYQGRRS